MEPEETLDRTIRRSSRAHGEKPAIFDAERSYTYGELEDVMDGISGHLAQLGVERGGRVAFLSNMHADYTAMWLGCVAAGAIPAPLHTRSSEEDQRAMCRAVEPQLLIYQEPYADDARSLASDDDVALESFGLDDGTGLVESALCFEGRPPDVELSSDDPATIFFTSGSTGVPRPFVHTHEAMVKAAQIETVMMDARRPHVSLNVFPPSVTAFVLLTLPYLAVGATTVSIPTWSPATMAEAIEEFQPTSTVITPTHARKFFQDVDADAVDTSSLETVVCGGEPASGDLLERMQSQLCENVSFGYGNTESFNSCVLFPNEADDSNTGSVGRPLPETEVRIFEPGEAEPQREKAAEEVGEIGVRSPLVAEGVWGEDTASDRFGEDGWLFTGDLGRLDEEGFLYIEGRVDNMILTGGRKVYPEHVETEIQSHPGVAFAVVVGLEDDEWGERVTAFVEASEDLTEEGLLAWCDDRDPLASYQVPKGVVFVDEIPRTTSGKVDRESLAQEA